MSELKAFNASQLYGFNESELHARGLGQDEEPTTYHEDLTLPNLTLLGGNARLYYYRSRLIYFNQFYRPDHYQYASPLITDIRFTTYFLTGALRGTWGAVGLPSIPINSGGTNGRIKANCINADTFVAFDPVNDTMSSHPGWSTDFSPRPYPWPTRLDFVGPLSAIGYPTVTGDAGFPGGAYDAFLSTYSSSWDDTTPCEPIANFDPTTELADANVRDGTWQEPYIPGPTPSTQTYNIAGFVLHEYADPNIACAMFFDSPWSFQMNSQNQQIVFHGGFLCMSERYIKRNYGPL